MDDSSESEDVIDAKEKDLWKDLEQEDRQEEAEQNRQKHEKGTTLEVEDKPKVYTFSIKLKILFCYN